MVKKILIAEDDSAINKLLKEIFEQQGFLVVSAFSGTETLLLAENQPFDVILLDLMLPGMKGEDVLVQLRQNLQTPIVVVSAKNDVIDKVSVLKMGADDFITKPLHKEELVARVDVQLRRKQNIIPEKRSNWRNLTIDSEKHTVSFNNQVMTVTNAEYDLIKILIQTTNISKQFGE